MDKEKFNDFERRNRLYHNVFEEYDSLNKTYRKFYAASDAYSKRGRTLTFLTTVFGSSILFIVGAVFVRGGPDWGTDVALAFSVIVAGLSFVKAVDSPQRMSNVTYNSGQTLQRVYLEFHYFVTVELPDPDNKLDCLEREYEQLLERKHIVNETTPQLGNKWYKRVKESHTNWEPKPLTEITGEDKEFVDNDDDDDDENQGPSRFVRFVRWLGY